MSVARYFSRSVLMLFAIGLLISSGCSSSKPAVTTPTTLATEGYAKAEKMYGNKDYDGAALTLESLLVTSRATALEDHVLFLLGKTYYNSGQYLLSSEIFTRLLKQVPSTPYAQIAQFLIAKSHEKLSPHYALDQQETVKAIDQFSVFMDLYPAPDASKILSDVETYRELLKINPENPLYKERYQKANTELAKVDTLKYAEKAIPVLRDKLAKSAYTIAQQYVQLKKYKAAVIFYDEIIKRYSDTGFVQQAWEGKIDALIKRKKWFEAGQVIDQYLQLYPLKLQYMKGMRDKIDQNLKKN
ncbi:MAG: outer membrane protein assembly factor BamD [Chlorobium sp.]|jgi:outer membrane protein assembly factor BamD|nr:MAG: outer membrane protein assembly factor BamD [Chlorobium sp.]